MENKEKIIQDNLDTHNWFVYPLFYDFIAKNPNINVIAEVGVWKGHSISYLVKEILKHNRKPKVYAIDIWEKWEENKDDDVPYSYDIYQENLKRSKTREYITDIKEYSDKAASFFPDNTFDFVYLDADHLCDLVKKDIRAWLPKVKKGGILGGHDYYEFVSNGNDVKTAVDKILKEELKMEVKLTEGNVWYVYI